MNNKRIIYFIFIILCLLLIFIFSSSNGKESNGFSKGLINKGIILYERITNTNIDNKVIITKLNYPIRKLAHFTIFLILGIFVYLYISTTNINNKVSISILICLICACIDETHQMFTFERTPKVLDVFIDTLGSMTAIIILNYKAKNN